MLLKTILVTNVVVTYRMIVRVVISRATLVLGLSLDLSTCLLQPTTYLGPFVAFTMTANQTKFKSVFLRSCFNKNTNTITILLTLVIINLKKEGFMNIIYIFLQSVALELLQQFVQRFAEPSNHFQIYRNRHFSFLNPLLLLSILKSWSNNQIL